MLKIQLELQERQQVTGHNMINKDDKIEILNNEISNANIHIAVLQNDILENPNADTDEKPTRQYVLNEFKSIKAALQIELASVQAS